MEGEEAMIAAGVGSRRDVSADEIEEAVHLALRSFSVAASSLEILATEREKAGTAVYIEAARRLGLTLIGVPAIDLGHAADRVLTHSARALEAKGVPSIAEAAALCAAGANARLLGARVATARATCAIAIGDSA